MFFIWVEFFVIIWVEENDLWKRKKVIVIILLFLGFGGYILFDQGIIKLDMFNKNSDVKEEKKEVKKEELDVNSRLVQNLYNSVTLDNDDINWYKYWIYCNSSNIREMSDFISDEASEIVKMNIVGINLR